ncbi:unnamed protein product, partial [Didymodactylos carnosus]
QLPSIQMSDWSDEPAAASLTDWDDKGDENKPPLSIPTYTNVDVNKLPELKFDSTTALTTASTT